MKNLGRFLFSLVLVGLMGCQELASYVDDSSSALAEVEASLEVGYASGDSAASVTQNLTLVTSAARNVKVSWSSDHAAVVSSGGGVTRPPIGADDVAVTLTATLTKNSRSAVLTFPVQVRALRATYAVTYEANGGTGTLSDATAYGSGQSVTVLANAFAREGYTFTGWNTQSNGGGTSYVAGASFTITSAITLYAQWTVNQFTVTFDSQGGSAVADQGCLSGALLTQPTNPTLTGNSFGGWYREAGCTTPWNFPTDTVTSNLTLFAKWATSTYTVKFYTDGVEYYQVGASHGAAIGAPGSPSKAGWEFLGWYTSTTSATAWNFTTDTVNSDLNLYAQWKVKTYTVKYDAQNGTSVTEANASYGALVTEPSSAPTKTGYTFSGWYRDSTGITAWNFASDTVTGDLTLYGWWAANSYTVTYKDSDGTVLGTASAVYGATLTTPSTPTKAGYGFTGWYTDSACTTKWVFGTTLVMGDTILWAGWSTAKTVRISFQYGDAPASAGHNVYVVWMENSDLSYRQNITVCTSVRDKRLSGDYPLPYWSFNRRALFSATDIDAVTAATVQRSDFTVSALMSDASVRKFTVYLEGDRSWDPNDWFGDQPALVYAADIDLDSGTTSYTMTPRGWCPCTQNTQTHTSVATGTLNTEMRYITDSYSSGTFGGTQTSETLLGATRMVKSLTVTIE